MLNTLNVHSFMRCRRPGFGILSGSGRRRIQSLAHPLMGVILDAGISVGLAKGSLARSATTPPEIRAGDGIMTEYYLILLSPMHTRTLQSFPRKPESSATPPRACVTCRIPNHILGSLPAPRF